MRSKTSFIIIVALSVFSKLEADLFPLSTIVSLEGLLALLSSPSLGSHLLLLVGSHGMHLLYGLLHPLEFISGPFDLRSHALINFRGLLGQSVRSPIELDSIISHEFEICQKFRAGRIVIARGLVSDGLQVDGMFDGVKVLRDEILGHWTTERARVWSTIYRRTELFKALREDDMGLAVPGRSSLGTVAGTTADDAGGVELSVLLFPLPFFMFFVLHIFLHDGTKFNLGISRTAQSFHFGHGRYVRQTPSLLTTVLVDLERKLASMFGGAGSRHHRILTSAVSVIIFFEIGMPHRNPVCCLPEIDLFRFLQVSVLLIFHCFLFTFFTFFVHDPLNFVGLHDEFEVHCLSSIRIGTHDLFTDHLPLHAFIIVIQATVSRPPSGAAPRPSVKSTLKGRLLLLLLPAPVGKVARILGGELNILLVPFGHAVEVGGGFVQPPRLLGPLAGLLFAHLINIEHVCKVVLVLVLVRGGLVLNNFLLRLLRVGLSLCGDGGSLVSRICGEGLDLSPPYFLDTFLVDLNLFVEFHFFLREQSAPSRHRLRRRPFG
mmetsp:Transcript_34819/g.80496  ORF Transcript_34819/g.80496 Transcript_34819/m.80496 type:complete len:546 (-) Transcript_34819:1482-3119(-)